MYIKSSTGYWHPLMIGNNVLIFINITLGCVTGYLVIWVIRIFAKTVRIAI